MRLPSWVMQSRFIASLAVATIVAAYAWTVYSKLRQQQFALIQQQQQQQQQHTGGSARLLNVTFETFRMFAVVFVAMYVVLYISERSWKGKGVTAAMHGGGGGGSVGGSGQLSLEDVMQHIDFQEPPF